MELNLGLRRSFKWTFQVADVNRPIIGMDFLAYYGLPVDGHRKRLIDETAQLIAPGHAVTGEIALIKTTNGESKYHRILAEYPNLTRASRAKRKTSQT